ncbi:Helix-turn-helix domain-containing protein [Plantibacter flavus]|uniref:Helix-turn-helix protein n=1 Tax=Plantibacter flavus TaxID=150123 RepID=A0A3N2BYA9_9MICO|nr:helix-turn-helix transcriptional regulator [Plantibacter flavus]ROR80213.1 helix-turn-helix protein [Plantibacter flavus]SMG50422.1 Helix-turn-helix domain-containing protein [Plantibacter flavus]
MLYREALGAALRTRRLEQGRTLQDVATAAAVSTPYLSEIERGRKDASSEVVVTIADALRTRLDALMFDIADRFETAAARIVVELPLAEDALADATITPLRPTADPQLLAA